MYVLMEVLIVAMCMVFFLWMISKLKVSLFIHRQKCELLYKQLRMNISTKKLSKYSLYIGNALIIITVLYCMILAFLFIVLVVLLLAMAMPEALDFLKQLWHKFPYFLSIFNVGLIIILIRDIYITYIVHNELMKQIEVKDNNL